MMNIFSPFPPPPHVDWKELPEEAARPKYWKCLGHLFPGVEGHYGIASLNGDLDIDREIELRVELQNVAVILDRNAAFTGDMMFARVGHDLVVRIVECDCASRVGLMAKN